MFSHSSTSAVTPGGTTVVESSWSIDRRALDRDARRAGRRARRPACRPGRRLVEPDVAPVATPARRRRRSARAARARPSASTPIAVTLQPVDLDRRVVAAVGVLALVLVVEALDGVGQRRRAASRRGTASERHWPEVAHVDRALRGARASVGDALGGEPLAAPRPRAAANSASSVAGSASSACGEEHRRTRSWRMSTSRQPSAEVMPGLRRHDHRRDRRARGRARRRAAGRRRRRRRARSRAGRSRGGSRSAGRRRPCWRWRPSMIASAAVARRRGRAARPRASSIAASASVAVERHRAADQLRRRAGRARGWRRCWSAASPPSP